MSSVKEFNKEKEEYSNDIQKNADSTLELANQLEEMNITGYEMISSYAIKDKLKEAFKNAEVEVNIMSPVVNNHIIYQKDIYYMMRDALARKVKINMIYSEAEKEISEDNEEEIIKSANADSLIKNLKLQFKYYTGLFNAKKYKINNNILICDNKFAVIGNYNFLSSDGLGKENENSKKAAVITDETTVERIKNKEFDF